MPLGNMKGAPQLRLRCTLDAELGLALGCTIEHAAAFDAPPSDAFVLEC